MERSRFRMQGETQDSGSDFACHRMPLFSQGLLEEATEALVKAGDERLSRVVLTWKYGAMAVAVAGDIVGGWQNHVSLVRCTNPSGCKGDTERGESHRVFSQTIRLILNLICVSPHPLTTSSRHVTFLLSAYFLPQVTSSSRLPVLSLGPTTISSLLTGKSCAR